MRKYVMCCILIFFTSATFGQLTKSYDEFEQETKYYTPLLTDVLMQKTVNKKNREKYYLNLKVEGGVYAAEPTGVIILFTDGTKWSGPYPLITSEKVGNVWVYRAIMIISNKDVKIFSTKIIDKFKIYVFVNDLSEAFGELFLQNVQELVKAK